jgi:hypothetical protein
MLNIKDMGHFKREQIPDPEDSESHTGKIRGEKNGKEVQRKEVNVECYSGVSKLADLLKDMSFPAPKTKIVEYVVESEDFTGKNKIINALKDLENRTYIGVADLTTSAGLVH